MQWDSVKAGLWTVVSVPDYSRTARRVWYRDYLDWTVDGTDQNSCIQTANVTKAMKGRLQLCLKLLPSLGLLRHRLLDIREVKGHVHI